MAQNSGNMRSSGTVDALCTRVQFWFLGNMAIAERPCTLQYGDYVRRSFVECPIYRHDCEIIDLKQWHLIDAAVAARFADFRGVYAAVPNAIDQIVRL